MARFDAESVVVFVKRRVYRKPVGNLRTDKMYESRKLDEIIEKQGPISVRQLCFVTGYSMERVRDHVDYVLEKGFARLGP